MKKIERISYQLVIIVTGILIIGCGSEKREEIIERYPSGAKYIVGVYKGTGSDEVFLKRKYYQENGKLGKVDDLVSDSTISYLDLYPKTNTPSGLKLFLQGSWHSIQKREHNGYNFYEIYSLSFEENELKKNLFVYTCNEENTRGIILSTTTSSEVEYKENLKIEEKNIEILDPTLYPTWDSFLRNYGLSREKFYHTLLVQFSAVQYLSDKLNESQDTTSLAYKLLTIDRLSIQESYIGETFQSFNLKPRESSELFETQSVISNIPLDLTVFRRKPIPFDCNKMQAYYQSISD